MAEILIPNQSFIDFLNHRNQTVVIDANLIIPPDRSSLKKNSPRALSMDFNDYKDCFLEPLFKIIPNIAIHEAVYEEICNSRSIRTYIDYKIENGEIVLLRDEDLSPTEDILRKTIEDNISQFTNYNSSIDNRNDRGEVKSISYSVAKGYIYFSTNDSNAISLIERSDLQTFLHSLAAIRYYELIYSIKVKEGSSNKLKFLYKLLYLLTKTEQAINPDWTTFNNNCDMHYGKYI